VPIAMIAAPPATTPRRCLKRREFIDAVLCLMSALADW
jgi:hypothetical protein